jgi:hypothetical protein
MAAWDRTRLAGTGRLYRQDLKVGARRSRGRIRMATENRTNSAGAAREELCGYAVVETLAAGGCYLAIGPGGRGVALKKLDPDCLLGRLLHPDVRDRLARVRELAHTGVANLFGVGKEADEAWLIWEYVQGQPFAEYAKRRCRTPRELAALARELVLTVESMHAQGIVHGAIQSGNVIVAPGGAIRLTHVSPLLYTDPADDAEAIADMVGAVLQDCGGRRDDPLAGLIAEARETKMPLRGLAARLANLADAREAPAAAPGDAGRREHGTRRRALAGALVIALAGGAIAYGVFAYGVWDSAAAGDPVRELLPRWLTGR